jgi:hypothetical protein
MLRTNSEPAGEKVVQESGDFAVVVSQRRMAGVRQVDLSVGVASLPAPTLAVATAKGAERPKPEMVAAARLPFRAPHPRRTCRSGLAMLQRA